VGNKIKELKKKVNGMFGKVQGREKRDEEGQVMPGKKRDGVGGKKLNKGQREFRKGWKGGKQGGEKCFWGLGTRRLIGKLKQQGGGDTKNVKGGEPGDKKIQGKRKETTCRQTLFNKGRESLQGNIRL